MLLPLMQIRQSNSTPWRTSASSSHFSVRTDYRVPWDINVDANTFIFHKNTVSQFRSKKTRFNPIVCYIAHRGNMECSSLSSLWVNGRPPLYKYGEKSTNLLVHSKLKPSIYIYCVHLVSLHDLQMDTKHAYWIHILENDLRLVFQILSVTHKY